MRSDNLLVAIAFLNLRQESLQTQTQVGTLGQPDGQALAHGVAEHKEPQLLAQLAVVALFGLLKHNEVFVQLFLLGERDGVDARQLRTVLVAAPVGAGQVDQLDGLDGAEIHQVRTAAQVGERAAVVEAYFAVVQLADALQLVLVALLGEEVDGLGLAHLAARDGRLGLHQLHHLLLNLGEIFTRYLIVHKIDIVVEAVLDGGAETELDAGIELLQSRGQQVGRGVPEGFLALLVVPRQQLDGSVLVDRTIQFNHLVVDLGREHIACQAFADAFGNLKWRYAGFILADRAVGKRYIYHIFSFFLNQKFTHNSHAQKKLQHPAAFFRTRLQNAKI